MSFFRNKVKQRVKIIYLYILKFLLRLFTQKISVNVRFNSGQFTNKVYNVTDNEKIKE